MSRCTDPGCGLIWLDPAPTAEDLPLAYQSYYTHAATAATPRSFVHRAFALARLGYLAARFGYPRGAHPVLERMLAPAVHLVPGRREQIEQRIMYLPARPGGRVIDVGCGSGEVMLELRELGWQVEGIDFDGRAVEAARAAGLSVRAGTLAEARYPEGEFDAVVMSHLIEHVPDPVELLRESRRILKPDGRLVAITPNHLGLGHRLFGGRWRGLEPPRHLQVFSPRALATAASRAGFAHVEVRTGARLAAMIWRESRPSLAPAGRPSLTERLLQRRLMAGTFQVVERSALMIAPDAGEELILVARTGARSEA